MSENLKGSDPKRPFRGQTPSGLVLFFAATILLFGVVWAVPRGWSATRSAQEQLYEQVELLAEAITVVQTEYVEPVEPKRLIYGAMKGLVESLDRHSQFLEPDAYSEMQVETKGEFGGVGLEITIAKDGVLTVVAPMDDTPAARAGLRPGDKLLKIDGDSTRGISLHEAVLRLRGRSGSQVKLTLFREEENRVFDAVLVRAVIQIRSVRQGRVSDGIGYLRISEFQDNTAEDLEKGLVSLEKEKLEGLILDLRNNPGGLLDVAVDVSGKFLELGNLVVSTKGRVQSQNQEFHSKEPHPRLGMPMVILVNGGSASASEIVAGALRDHGRAILMGAKTFGKGSVQTVIPLRDGSAIRLTTSIYYTPSGQAIHGKGLDPDVMVDERKEQESDEERPSAKESSMARDPLVIRAVDLLKGLQVYQQKKQAA